ncbi:hypothetical protein C8Q80DRAFT_1129935 [Daedaleopsis nitida]|nr:hypothetical protein C8Q80DRAFT_1129935 [Daedaleopsis nitida]
MDYFDLPPVSQTTSTQAASSSASLLPSESSGTPHAVIALEDGQDDSRTPVGTPLNHPGDISISTAFHAFLLVDGSKPDVILVATDGVHFYVHRQRLLNVSTNRMGNLIPPEPTDSTPPQSPTTPLTLHISCPSHVTNVILHVIYGLSCAQYLPTLEIVEAAVDALHLFYGVPINAVAAPQMPLFQLLLSFAPFRPLDAYALAAHYSLEELCVAISSHLLAYDLARLTDSVAQKMGPLYLKRLFLLHQTRLAALRTILYKAPSMHPPAPGCSEQTQQQLKRAWAFAVAHLVWDVIPSVSTSALRALLEPIGEAISCPFCIATLQQRVQEVVYEWAAVKRTI